jgi:putative photosynthetic complex assembly protein 2
MIEHGWPALFVVFTWYLSTGALLYLVGLPSRVTRAALIGATLLLAPVLQMAATAAAEPTVGYAYLGFAAGLAVWAWQEMAFLTGAITGPRRFGTTSGTWRHAWHATLSVAHHELAIAVGAATLLVMSWGQPHPVALWTYLGLWAMRLSAKLNLFLGVRNLNEAFLPDHLGHLSQFLRKRAMNWLFPVSILVGTTVTAIVLLAAVDPATDPARAVALTLVGTLLGLAMLEHWFMVLPLPAERLFTWGLRSREVPVLATPAAVPHRGRIVVPVRLPEGGKG